jgi:hypothetical protein
MFFLDYPNPPQERRKARGIVSEFCISSYWLSSASVSLYRRLSFPFAVLILATPRGAPF